MLEWIKLNVLSSVPRNQPLRQDITTDRKSQNFHIVCQINKGDEGCSLILHSEKGLDSNVKSPSRSFRRV